MTNFGSWYPLVEAAAHTPEEEGVFQIKIPAGLVDYPSGKSAMVYYGAAVNLRSALAELVEQRNRPKGTAFLCRHQTTAASNVLLRELLERFQRRFGTIPTWPRSSQ